MRLLIIAFALLLTGCQASDIFVKEEIDAAPEGKLMTVRNEALTAYRTKDYKTALPLYQKLTTEVSADPELWFHLGNIYARLGQPNKAVDSYESTLKLNARHSRAWHNMGVMQLRMSANTFTQMLQNIPPNDPLHRRAEILSETLLKILGNKAPRKSASSGAKTN